MNSSPQSEKIQSQLQAAESALANAYESLNAARIQKAESRLSNMIEKAEKLNIQWPPRP